MTDDEFARQTQFLQLFLQHEDALRSFVRSLVPTRDDAFEVMQNTAAVLWRKFGEVENSEDFRRWAYGVARLEALTYRRTRARDRHVFSEETLALLSAAAEESSDQLEAERRALNECLEKLTEPQRALIRGAYSSGVRIIDLASRSGRTPMALYKTLHRIRLALMECTQRALARETAT